MKKFYNTTIVVIIEVLLIVPAVALILAKYALKAIAVIVEASIRIADRLLQLVIDVREDLVDALSVKK